MAIIKNFSFIICSRCLGSSFKNQRVAKDPDLLQNSEKYYAKNQTDLALFNQFILHAFAGLYGCGCKDTNKGM
jgi:hypothetical protein